MCFRCSVLAWLFYRKVKYHFISKVAFQMKIPLFLDQNTEKSKKSGSIIQSYQKNFGSIIQCFISQKIVNFEFGSIIQRTQLSRGSIIQSRLYITRVLLARNDTVALLLICCLHLNVTELSDFGVAFYCFDLTIAKNQPGNVEQLL